MLDVTTVIMGPYATAQLGDLGTDVINIELPGGDIARQLGPRRSTDYRPAPSVGPHLATVSWLEDDRPLKHEENEENHHGHHDR